MREAPAQNLLDAGMARGAKLGLPGGQQRAMIGGMWRVALQTCTLDGRHVAGSSGLTRSLVAVEAENGAGGRSDDGLCLIVAGVTGELRVDRSAQEILTCGAVRGVAGLAVHNGGHREPPVGGGKAVSVFMAAATEGHLRLVQ
jgi:hypothetical protein